MDSVVLESVEGHVLSDFEDMSAVMPENFF
jgi:hypothetical protein